MQLPRYICHKQVCALKIKEIEQVFAVSHEGDGRTSQSPIGSRIVPEDDRYAPFSVGMDYVNKHNPKVGGYYVRYDDGYESWSPAKAFEDGYTLIGA